jgi:hypothetical protein
MKGPFKVTTISLNTNRKGNYSRNFKRETTQETSKGKLFKKLPKRNYSGNFLRETTQETS